MNVFRSLFLLGITAFTSVFANQKVALFNDTTNWYHWGCTGTSTALKEGIEGLGFDLQAVPINYDLKEVPEFEEFNDLQKFEKFCEANKETIETIRNSTAIVITGEGTLHDLRPRPKSLLYLAHISKIFFGKHVEIINHSAYPKDDPNPSSFIKNHQIEKERAEAIYKTIYNELDFIAIREPFSHNEMSGIDVSSTLSFDCLPLYIKDHYDTEKKVEEKTLVIAGSVAFTENGVENLSRYIEIMSEKGFKVKVLIGAAAYPSKDDQLFIKSLKTHCKVPTEIIDASSMEEWLDTINQATLLVSGRFHHSIAAFCLNTPFIALNSNTSKVQAISTLLEQPETLLFSDPNLLNHLLERTNSIISAPTVNNDTKVAEICKLAEKNFEGLKSIAETTNIDQNLP